MATSTNLQNGSLNIKDSSNNGSEIELATTKNKQQQQGSTPPVQHQQPKQQSNQTLVELNHPQQQQQHPQQLQKQQQQTTQYEQQQHRKVLNQRLLNGYRLPTSVAQLGGSSGIDSGNYSQYSEIADMNRRIQLNGGSELQIDDKNISLHINNNPFVTSTGLGNGGQNNTLGVNMTDEGQGSGATITHYRQNFDEYADPNKLRPKRPHSIPVTSPLNDMNNDMKSTIYTSQQQQRLIVAPRTPQQTTTVSQKREDKEPIYASASFYGPYRNTSSRLNVRPNEQVPLYTPPSPISNHQQQQLHVQTGMHPVVPRRSHSTPRPPTQTPTTPTSHPTNIIVNGQIMTAQRPRSLDRCNGIEKSYKPPPIPTRRLSQPLSGNSPVMTSASGKILTQSTRSNSSGNCGPLPLVPPHMQKPLIGGQVPQTMQQNLSGMRHSATFHGDINRQSPSAFHAQLENGSSGNISDSGLGTLNQAMINALNTASGTSSTKRKPDRPMSYAYGTIPDQAFLENQLRIYSEQLRTITESVRKYSEQAKLLSELKRQQQMRKQQSQTQSPHQAHTSMTSSKSANSFLASHESEPKPSTEPVQTPSHQLRVFLDSIRSSMRGEAPPNEDQPAPEEKPKVPVSKSHSDLNTAASGTGQYAVPQHQKSSSNTARTPSDQLRLFLDAIRSNQFPDGETPPLAAMKTPPKDSTGTRPKSANIENFDHSSIASESFHQISDNLRIMSQDLEALSPSKSLKNSQTPTSSASAMGQKALHHPLPDVNQILDNFHQLADQYKACGSLDYLKKCSDALRQTTDQLKLAQLQNSNGYGDSPEGSSCSTTPGSIREAVQNLLAQPRNGFQILDDRMRLFIDILDSQEKFSQVLVE
ncbi:unnamed protein product [Hermetia illucens]|uniref:Uncharacterized protein n=1 Tax=Hermetia illucens TaxID=343691 RepID=A0A7R8V7H7_HERIL|nr:unnamed protein product [Hermetia illucens]